MTLGKITFFLFCKHIDASSILRGSETIIEAFERFGMQRPCQNFNKLLKNSLLSVLK